MVICSWRNGSSERLCILLVVWQMPLSIPALSASQAICNAISFGSLSFCLISLSLIKILFLSKQLTKACLMTSNHQVSEECHSYKKSPHSYCNPFFILEVQENIMKSLAQKAGVSCNTIKIYAVVMLRGRPEIILSQLLFYGSAQKDEQE